ncbi:torsin-like protein [Bactrocera neohumeralis]|uniref:torsin-like protein n=1 Tax=Bactrocera tryoni TaxID=59916 RepID=UPI001A984836|nr:torsin-like protein [Bactrocera tryoni]XP_050328293.1 torsin-like protein [Bactrocera neohumeralis]
MHFTQIFYISLYLLAVSFKDVICFFDPVSLTIGAGVGLGALTGYGFLKDQTYCRLTECCNERSIPGDVYKLRKMIQNRLFGQHIVKQQLISALEAHLNPRSSSRKPLVMSFHGTPGTGKNFVADMIAETLFEKGVKSRFVHKYMGRLDFPLQKNVESYNERIYYDVVTGIRDCPRSLFIFDEVDKMPAGVFESLASLVDYNALPDKLDGSKAIFIFLSNLAGVQISDQLAKMLKNGVLRENIKLSSFEQILEKAAYNLEGGLKRAGLIEQHVIDHFIPFLPLEKQHVHQCISAEFFKWERRPEKQKIEDMLKEVITYDRVHGLFSTTGCKTIEKKVATEVWIEKRLT